MNPCPSVGDLLHDGSIVGISGSVPGAVVLAVDIEYLRTRFETPGNRIFITLGGCLRFSYKPWSSSEEVTDLFEIAAKELEILSADQGDAFCTVHYSAHLDEGGVLEIFSEVVALRLDDGKTITIDELDKAAEEHWTEWEAQNRKPTE